MLLCTRRPAGTVGLITASLWHTFRRTSALSSDNCVSGRRDMSRFGGDVAAAQPITSSVSHRRTTVDVSQLSPAQHFGQTLPCAHVTELQDHAIRQFLCQHTQQVTKFRLKIKTRCSKTCSRSKVTQPDLSLTKKVSSIKIHLTLKQSKPQQRGMQEAPLGGSHVQTKPDSDIGVVSCRIMLQGHTLAL